MRAIIEANRALVSERDALREALEMMVEMVEMNGFGRDYAMDVARAALAQGGAMTNQQSINDILTAALQEVRRQHGLAVHTIRVEWTGTADRPAIAITRIEVEGSVNDAHEQGQGES